MAKEVQNVQRDRLRKHVDVEAIELLTNTNLACRLGIMKPFEHVGTLSEGRQETSVLIYKKLRDTEEWSLV